MNSSILTQEYLKEILHYDSGTGIFTRIKSTRGHFAGTAGSKRTTGYIRIKINGVEYQAHRLAFLYMLGYMPKVTDHINHKRDDNRWVNLRSVTTEINGKNKKVPSNNKYGISGVCKKSVGLHSYWYVYVSANKTTKNLTTTKDFFEACCVRKSAELINKYHYNHGL